jgi:hypothetical protein
MLNAKGEYSNAPFAKCPLARFFGTPRVIPGHRTFPTEPLTQLGHGLQVGEVGRDAPDYPWVLGSVVTEKLSASVLFPNSIVRLAWP